MPWRLTSSTKTPSPWTSRWSSLRGTFWPMKPRLDLVLLDGERLLRCDGGLAHAPTSPFAAAWMASTMFDVARAAADVALDRAPDLLVGRLRVVLEQVLRAHQHPRRAVAALQRVVAANAFCSG